MLDTAYDSRALKHLKIDRIKDQITSSERLDQNNQVILQQRVAISEAMEAYMVGFETSWLHIVPEHTTVDEFNHPMLVNVNGRQHVAVDVRQFVNGNVKKENGITIRDHVGLTTMIIQSKLESQWGNEGRRNDMAYALGSFPLRVWIQWLTQAFVSARNITPADQKHVRILLALYYHDMFLTSDVRKLNNYAEREVISGSIARTIGVDYEDVMSVSNQYPELGSLDVLVDALKSTSIRLDTLTPAMLMTLVQNSWEGVRSRSLCTLALEHPPAFLAILLTLSSVGESYLFRKTVFGKTVEHLGRKTMDEFVRRASILD